MSSKIGLSVQLNDAFANKEQVAVLEVPSTRQPHAGKRVLTISQIAATNVIPFVEEEANKGNWVAKATADFFADNTGTKNQAPKAITSIVIVDKDAKGWTVARLQRLIYLKLAIRDNADTAQIGEAGVDPDGTTPATARNNQWVFTLHNLQNDPAIQINAGVMTIDLNAMTPDLKTDFDIDDVNLVADGTGKRTVRWKFTKSQNALLELENLLNGYWRKYGMREKRFLSSASTADKSQIWDWVDPTTPTYPTQDSEIENDAKKLWEEYGKYATPGENFYGVASAAADNSQIKSVLANLVDGRTAGGAAADMYKWKLTWWVDYLEGVKSAVQRGLTNNYEVIIYFSNGFTLGDTVVGKKYKGFPVIVPGQRVVESTIDPGRVNDAEIGGKHPFVRGTYNIGTNNAKTSINNLRSLAVRVGGGTTANLSTNFSTQGAATTTDASHSIFAEESRITKQQLCGFQPGDLEANKNYNSSVFGHTAAYDLKSEGEWETTFKENLVNPAPQAGFKTKVMFDIKTVGQNSTDWKEVIKVAFAGLRDDTSGSEALHELDEFAKHVDTLTKYYQFIQNGVDVHNGNMQYAHNGKTYQGITPNDDTTKFAKAVDGCYTEAQKWAKIWDTSYTDSNKSQAETDKVIVEKFLSQSKPADTSTDYAAWMRFFIKTNAKWKKVLGDKKVEMDKAIRGDGGSHTIGELIKDGSEIAKAIYGAAKTKGGYKDSDKPTPELKALVELIEKVKDGTADGSALTSLEEYEEATEASDEKKIAWDIANEVKGKVIDNSTDGAGIEALKKLRGDLKIAREAAKNELGEEAYNDIGIEQENDIKKINDIKELFGKAKQAWGISSKTEASFDSLLTELGEAEKNGGTEAWKAINKHLKDKDGNACSEGYAAGVLKRLEGLKEKGDKGMNKIRTATTPEKVREEWNNLSPDEKANVSENDMRRVQALIKLTGNDLEKKLGKALGEKNSADEYTEDDAGYKAVNEAIKILKRFKGKKASSSGSEEEKILQKLKDIPQFTDPDSVISEWLGKLEVRQKFLKEKLNKKDDQNPSEEKNFWTSWPMIFVYGIGAAIVLGGLAWLAFKGGSGEGDEEE